MFKFKEFNNPLEQNYDISSSLKDNKQISINPQKTSKLTMELIDLVGLLEDGEWEEYGMSEDEYLNPTEDTIKKVNLIVNNVSNEKHL